MNNILIREARASDLPAIGKLLEELVNAMASTESIDTRIAVENCKSLFKDASSCLLVAVVERTPVGFVNFRIRQTILHRSPSALIDELVVAKEYQGKGVGKQLVLAVIEKCKQLGCCEAEVSTEKTNLRARKFYKRCGFQERGTIFEVGL